MNGNASVPSAPRQRRRTGWDGSRSSLAVQYMRSPPLVSRALCVIPHVQPKKKIYIYIYIKKSLSDKNNAPNVFLFSCSLCKCFKPKWNLNALSACSTVPLRSHSCCLSILFCPLLTLCVVLGHLNGERQTSVLRGTAALMPWLHYYFTQLSDAIRAISCSNDFCEEKKINWHWHICPFFIPLQGKWLS